MAERTVKSDSEFVEEWAVCQEHKDTALAARATFRRAAKYQTQYLYVIARSPRQLEKFRAENREYKSHETIDGMIECEPRYEWAIQEKDARVMPAAVRREKEGHLSLHVALNRPEASALAPDSRP